VLKSLQLTNFRGLEQLELKRLNRVNLIVGDNNTGKTSILEALYLLLGDGKQLQEFASSFRATEQEGKGGQGHTPDSFERFWLWLFKDHDTKNRILLSGNISEKEKLEVFFESRSPHVGEGYIQRRNSNGTGYLAELKTDAIGFFDLTTVSALSDVRVSKLSVRPSNPVEDAHRFNQVVNQSNGEEAAESYMRKVESRLKKLRYRKLRQNSDAVVYAELAGLPEFIPSTQLGQAFTRVLHIYCEVMLEKAGVLLADEIENGIYFGNLLPFWNVLLDLIDDQQAQLFATTHSFECLKAAHQAACARADAGSSYDLNIIRLDRMDWGIKATEFGRDEMEAAIANGWEMR